MKPSGKIEYRIATSDDVPQIRKVWQEVFGDSTAYIDFFLSDRCDLHTTLVCTVDDIIVSQLFLLPAKLKAGETTYPAYYLFAAATLPAFRGRGFMGNLLRFAEDVCKQNAAKAIALLPGEESLYDYYARFGYAPVFSAKHWQGTRDELLPFASETEVSVSYDAVQVLKKQQESRDGIQWSEQDLQYALQEHLQFRGQYIATQNAFVSASDECVILASPSHFSEGVTALLNLTQDDNLELRLPPDAPIGHLKASGMLRCVDEAIPLQNGFLTFPME